MKKQITFPLKIDKDLWDEFKDHVPRTIKLNDIITSLIKEHLTRKNAKDVQHAPGGKQ